MPPPSAGRLGSGGGLSEHDRQDPGVDRSPQPGPSGLGVRSWSSTGLVPSILSIRNGTILSGPSSASSGSSITWGNRQV